MPAASLRLGPPSLALLGIEPVRALLEFGSSCLASRGALPRGDGHLVILFPGLGASGRAMTPLRRHCEALGYATQDWGRGTNRGPDGDVQSWLDALAGEVGERLAGHAAPVSLLGWSLGGIFAREVAKRLRSRVRQVITMGAPFAGTPAMTHAGWLYRLLNGSAPRVAHRILRDLRVAPPVPTTSIYSRSDGVVAWQACVAGKGPCVENVEVQSSHLGLTWHPQVLAVVADRLAQPEGKWRPMQAPSAGAAVRAKTGDFARPRRRTTRYVMA